MLSHLVRNRGPVVLRDERSSEPSRISFIALHGTVDVHM
jgi:hypothetical protein